MWKTGDQGERNRRHDPRPHRIQPHPSRVSGRQDGGSRRLMGVGRLVADPMKASAEYAVLVGDAWQDKGLGGVLTDYCLEIARDWGVRKITAVTTADNPRMMAVFKKRDFSIRFDEDGSTVEVEKDLK
ncbi:MAG: GNAT family N-acetyltransferase [Candidatus Aminicenantales bacterium]